MIFFGIAIYTNADIHIINETNPADIENGVKYGYLLDSLKTAIAYQNTRQCNPKLPNIPYKAEHM